MGKGNGPWAIENGTGSCVPANLFCGAVLEEATILCNSEHFTANENT